MADRSSTGWAVSISCAAALTSLLFAVLPFAHHVVKPDRTLELRKASVANLPPPIDEKTAPPPPPEREKPPEALPPPQLAESFQQMPISADLDIAVGTGGALAGFGEIRALASIEKVKEEAFDVTELEKRPEVVSQVQAVYPPDLRKAKIEGSVTLVFVLDESGRVTDPRVEQSTRPEFEKPALEAVRKWRFRPGMRDGQAVRTYVRIPMRFRISSG